MIKFCDSFTDPAIDELWLDIEVIVMNEIGKDGPCFDFCACVYPHLVESILNF